MALMHDPRVAVGGLGVAAGGGTGSFIGMDPPAHNRMRQLATSHFEQTEAVRPDMVSTATELIDQMRGKQQIDLVDDFAYPLPVTVICRQLGVPHDDEPRFHPWAEAIITQLDPRPGQQDVAAQASAEMNQYMAQLVERYRAEPGDGLLSGLAAEEGLSTEDVVATGRLLLIAGHETTVNLIGNGMLALLRHPAQLARLRDEPTLIANAVDELLRYDGPVQFSRRILLQELTIEDVVIPRNTVVLAGLGPANHDPAHFGDDADELDLTRELAPQHLAFGGGIHHCLGAVLARAEARAAIGGLVRRFPDLELAPELRGGDQPAWNGRLVLRGLDALPVSVSGR
jgi:cytochrome P450